MTIKTENKLITEIRCTASDYNAYIKAGKWIPTSNVKFFKHIEGYVMCNCKTTNGISLIKIIITNYFK
jgi:hypothetical protein